MTAPRGIDLEQYRTQAKGLLKRARAAQPEALDRLRQHHPEHDCLPGPGSIRLADTQLVVARENGFPSWAKFKSYLLFRNAVQALDSGDLQRLEALLDQHPFLLRYRCRTGEWYEQGYFAGATLLNHIAGNPIRCPIPPNILDITRLLLSRHFEPRDAQYTVGLLLTSQPASEAGVALPLVDLLVAAGAQFDLKDKPDILSVPLGEGAFATAEELIRRGARMDIRHAAALGRLDLVKRFVNEEGSLSAAGASVPAPGAGSQERKAQLEEAFIRACMCGRTGVAGFLLEQGVDPSAGAGTAQTGMHYAAHGGHLDTVKLLIERNAPLEVRNMYGGTVLGQAVWSAIHEPQDEHIAIIEALIDAGANVSAVGFPTGHEGVDEVLQRHRAD
jgi:ankyrin repeat protein